MWTRRPGWGRRINWVTTAAVAAAVIGLAALPPPSSRAASSPTAVATATPTTAASPSYVATAAPSPAPTPVATPVPTPLPTPIPTPVPTVQPTPDPYALTAANVKQSILDNAHSPFLNTNFDAIQVQIQTGGQVVVVAKPTTTWDEQGFITYAAEDALVVVKAVSGWYPDATVIHIQLDSGFTDAYGQATSEPGAWIEFTSATAAKMNPAALTTRTFGQPTDLFAIADAYAIHPAIWKNIDAKHRGQLLSFDNGPALIDNVPA